LLCCVGCARWSYQAVVNESSGSNFDGQCDQCVSVEYTHGLEQLGVDQGDIVHLRIRAGVNNLAYGLYQGVGVALAGVNQLLGVRQGVVQAACLLSLLATKIAVSGAHG